MTIRRLHEIGMTRRRNRKCARRIQVPLSQNWVLRRRFIGSAYAFAAKHHLRMLTSGAPFGRDQIIRRVPLDEMRTLDPDRPQRWVHTPVHDEHALTARTERREIHLLEPDCAVPLVRRRTVRRRSVVRDPCAAGVEEQIGVDSVQGGGSVFTVFLPRARSGDEVRARQAGLERFSTGRVLVMDDDERIRAYTGAMLTKLGYTSDLARDGEEAVALYRRYFEVGRPYDAVILDSAVSHGQGGEAAFGTLREFDPDLRAILAGEDGETAERCLARGFCGWLVKPYGAADLGKVLKTVLG